MHPNPSLRILAASLLACLAQSTAFATPSYSVKDVGPINGSFKAAAMNDKGWITGTAPVGPDGAYLPFITGPNGNKSRPLPAPEGSGARLYSINNHGMVAGTLSSAANVQHAFVTGEQGSAMRDISTNIGSDDGMKSGAWAVNNHGQVAGYLETTPNYIRGFVYDSATDKTTLLGDCPVDASNAQAINDKGVIAGTFICSETDKIHVFIAKPPGYAFVAYDVPSGLGYQVTAVSQKGSVLGFMGTTDGTQSFVIRPGKAMQQLKSPKNLPLVVALAQTDEGRIVGSFEPAETNELRAFVCNGDCSDLTDLNSLATLPAGVLLTQALSINAGGQILASGSDGHGYLLTPSH